MRKVERMRREIASSENQVMNTPLSNGLPMMGRAPKLGKK